MWRVRSADDASRYVHQRHDVDTTAEFACGGQNTNAREARRVGKLAKQIKVIKFFLLHLNLFSLPQKFKVIVVA